MIIPHKPHLVAARMCISAVYAGEILGRSAEIHLTPKDNRNGKPSFSLLLPPAPKSLVARIVWLLAGMHQYSAKTVSHGDFDCLNAIVT